MVKYTESYLSCDICGKQGAETWLIGNPESERAKVDLCSVCERPVRKAFIAGRKSGLVGPQGADVIHSVVFEDYTPSPQALILPNDDAWNAAKERRDGNG